MNALASNSIKRLLAIFLIATALLLIPPTHTQAVSPSDAQDIKNQIEESKSNLSNIYERYNIESNRLEEINNRIDSNAVQLEELAAKLQVRQDVLNKRVKFLYGLDDVNFIDIVMSSKNFNELLTNMEFFNRITNQDASVVKQVKVLRVKVKHAQESLYSDRKEQRFLVAYLDRKKAEMEGELEKQKGLLASIEEQIKAARPVSVSAYNLNIGSFVFPAQAPYSFYDDWGQSRGGGTRTHKGTDIMSTYGNEAYAVVSGYVSVGDGGAGGLWITLNGDDGNQYWYMHMASYAITGGHVEAGQVIGYIGDSGNAQGGPAHIHFEFHPGGGGAVDPYPLLVASG
ncbi:MAG: hypothetical protein C4562_06835 [Actinobacteria bacterium]|nr:MAG: hypothetical protein C4562_06835 [Actinomycetota bacterium]